MKLTPEQQRQAAKNLRERAALSTRPDEKHNMLNKAKLLEKLALLQERRAQKA
jgi:hypothetical protein